MAGRPLSQKKIRLVKLQVLYFSSTVQPARVHYYIITRVLGVLAVVLGLFNQEGKYAIQRAAKWCENYAIICDLTILCENYAFFFGSTDGKNSDYVRRKKITSFYHKLTADRSTLQQQWWELATILVLLVIKITESLDLQQKTWSNLTH